MTTIERPQGGADDVAEVTWDLSHLLDGRDEAAVDELLEEADRRAGSLSAERGRVGGFDADALVRFMTGMAALHDALGRAGAYASLRVATDVTDPARSALMQRVQERATAIRTTLLFFDLEWAALEDSRVEELLGDERLAFCRHHLEAERRHRQHLLSEPEERVLAEKQATGRAAWARLFSQLTSTIEVELDGATATLEAGLSRLQSNDPGVRRAAAAAVTAGLAPGLRTRAFIFNTLLHDKAVDDRLRGYPTWLSSRNLSNEASDESVQALVEAVRRRFDIPHRWYALKAAVLGVERIADHDRVAVVIFDIVSFSNTVATEGVARGREDLLRLAGAVEEVASEEAIRARFGDAEICAVLPGMGAEGAYELAEEVLRRLTEDPGDLWVDAGVAGYPEHGENAGELLSAASRALSTAKRVGGSGIIVAR